MPEPSAKCQIIVNGQDVTSRFDPHLISVVVVDKEGGEVDTCAIELKDDNGELAIPPDGASLKVRLGWSSMKMVFDGVVSSVESGFARGSGGGRRLWIEGTGADMKGPGKTPMQKEWGLGVPPGEKKGQPIPMSQVIQEAGQKAGFSVKVAPSLSSIKRDYWSQNESFFHFGQRLAAEFGGVFKVSGKNASITKGTDFLNALGQPTGNVTATWGKNLISWRIKPFAGRPQIKQGRSQWFDPWKPDGWMNSMVAPGGGGPFGKAGGSAQRAAPGPDQEGADQQAGGFASDSETERGTGYVVIIGNPSAMAGGKITISGARGGVDGGYRIKEAEHAYSRANNGYITRCDVSQPDGGGGYYSGRKEWGGGGG